MTFCVLQYWIGTKFRALNRLSRALGTLVLRKFGHLPISHKVRGNTGCDDVMAAKIEFLQLHEDGHFKTDLTREIIQKFCSDTSI